MQSSPIRYTLTGLFLLVFVSAFPTHCYAELTGVTPAIIHPLDSIHYSNVDNITLNCVVHANGRPTQRLPSSFELNKKYDIKISVSYSYHSDIDSLWTYSGGDTVWQYYDPFYYPDYLQVFSYLPNNSSPTPDDTNLSVFPFNLYNNRNHTTPLPYDLRGSFTVKLSYATDCTDNGNNSYYPYYTNRDTLSDSITYTLVASPLPKVHIKGNLFYQRYVDGRCASNSITKSPLVFTTVKLFSVGTGNQIDSTNTDDAGLFNFPTGQDSAVVRAGVYVKAIAEFRDSNNHTICQVRPSPNGTLYSLRTQDIRVDTLLHHIRQNSLIDLGNDTLPSPVDSINEGAMAIGQTIIKGNIWVNDTLSITNLGNYQVVWKDSGYVDTSGFGNSRVNGIIYIDKKDHSQWNDCSVLHEFGHIVADTLKISNSQGAKHDWDGPTNELKAWTEGFCNFFACAVTNSPFYINFNTVDSLGFSVNIETGQIRGQNVRVLTEIDAIKGFNEGKVAGILWDLRDNNVNDAVQPDSDPDGICDNYCYDGFWTTLTTHDANSLFTEYDLYNKISSSFGSPTITYRTPDYPKLWSVYWEHNMRSNDSFPTPPPPKVDAIYWKKDCDSIAISWTTAFRRKFSGIPIPISKVYRKSQNWLRCVSGLITTGDTVFVDTLRPAKRQTTQYSVTSLTNIVGPDSTLHESYKTATAIHFGKKTKQSNSHFKYKISTYSFNDPEDSLKYENFYDYFIEPDTMYSGDTSIIYPNYKVILADIGKLVVDSGGVLIFAGRDSTDSLNKMTTVKLYDGATLSNPAIEVLPGGKVIGKHAHFENLPIVIHNQGGIVELDSCEFVNCAHPIIDTLQTDTLTLTNIAFKNDSNGVAVYGTHTTTTRPVTIRNCSFHNIANIAISIDSIAGLSDISQCTMDSTTYAIEVTHLMRNVLVDSCNITADDGIYAGMSTVKTDTLLMRRDTISSSYISWFHNAATVDADSCVFTSKTAGAGYGVVFDGESNDSLINRVRNSKISGFLYGAWALYANATLERDSIWNNSKVGISWDHNNSSADVKGRITECDVHNNGSNQFSKVGGIYIVSSDPILTCNHIYANRPNACYINNGGRPLFKDTLNAKVGANVIEGDSTRIFYMIGSTPDFENGGNTFILGSSTYFSYGGSVSSKIKLAGNYFEPHATLNRFYPADTVHWDTTGQSSAGLECGATLSNKRIEEPERNSCFVIDSLLERFAQKQTSLKELLTYKGPDRKELLFSVTYQLDAEKDFSIADNVREVILQESNSYDSLRVRYDKYLSNWLLRTPKAKRKPFEYENLEIARAMTDSMLAMSQVMSPTQPEAPLPKSFKLYPVYPNPFNSTTRIHFDVPTSSKVKIIVYDALGRKVATLADKNFQAGSYHIEWNGNNASGMKVSSGVYFISMRSPSFVATKKAVLLK